MKIRLLHKENFYFGKSDVNKVIKYYPSSNLKREGKLYGLGFIELDLTKTFWRRKDDKRYNG